MLVGAFLVFHDLGVTCCFLECGLEAAPTYEKAGFSFNPLVAKTASGFTSGSLELMTAYQRASLRTWA
jgi:hypothetical protein